MVAATRHIRRTRATGGLQLLDELTQKRVAGFIQVVWNVRPRPSEEDAPQQVPLGLTPLPIQVPHDLISAGLTRPDDQIGGEGLPYALGGGISA
jgi:hypothetical protein